MVVELWLNLSEMVKPQAYLALLFLILMAKPFLLNIMMDQVVEKMCMAVWIWMLVTIMLMLL